MPAGWPDREVARHEQDTPDVTLATAVAEHAHTLTPAELMGIVPNIPQRAAGRLPDDGHADDAMPVIRVACRTWADEKARQTGQVTDPSDVDGLAQAVYDLRHDMRPLTPYLRDPHVENVDINGCDQNLADSPTCASSPLLLAEKRCNKVARAANQPADAQRQVPDAVANAAADRTQRER